MPLYAQTKCSNPGGDAEKANCEREHLEPLSKMAASIDYGEDL
jgi:hypothetical protein